MSQVHKQRFIQEMIETLIQAGFTQETLAKLTKLSVSTIQKILAGRTQQVRPQTFAELFRLYCAYKVAVERGLLKQKRNPGRVLMIEINAIRNGIN